LALWRRSADGLDDAQRAALARLVSTAKLELIPLRHAPERVAELPPGATVTVTASPSHGIEATLDIAELAAAAGHTAIPHLSAHMIRDRAHLAELLARISAAGMHRAFVVGGDAKDPGEFHDALSLLRAIDDHGHELTEIGVTAYPEGHVDIPPELLLSVLLEKQRYASYMTTQMCFSPQAIVTWVGTVREAGVTLPIHLGTPGVADLAKLMTISARIGIADSARYLKKNRNMVGRLLTPGKFGPDALLEGLGPALVDRGVRIEALHIFTFNQIVATVEWQREMLANLRG
jgi:methylenetetrahydrofolate reductase (NADPH)